jgi:hypothetical protein
LTSMESTIRLMRWKIADWGLRIWEWGFRIEFLGFYSRIKARINGKKETTKKR